MKRFITVTLLIVLCLSLCIPAQATSYQVNNLQELQNAIADAEDGDTIEVGQTIIIDTPTDLGFSEKVITLSGNPEGGTFLRFEGDEDGVFANVVNLVFDGSAVISNGNCNSTVISNASGIVQFKNVTWQKCSSDIDGGGLYVSRGLVTLDHCAFFNCWAKSGGAVIVEENGACSIAFSEFSGNSCTITGGAICSESDLVEISNTTFHDNHSYYNYGIGGNGGAIYGSGYSIRNSVISGNSAQNNGGGVYATDIITIDETRIYANQANTAGSDIYANNGLTMTTADYNSLYADDLATGGYSTASWHSDIAGNRYSPDNVTETITGPFSGELAMAMIFASSPKAEPKPDEPAELPPAPSPTPKIEKVIIERIIEKPIPEKEKNDKNVNLSCGEAVLDSGAAASFVPALKKLFPAQKLLTRGETASILYGLLTNASKARCNEVVNASFNDMGNSPYKVAVLALTPAKALLGRSDGTFGPDDVLTFGELLSILVRFEEAPTGFFPNVHETDHWATSALQKAVALEWFPDVPLNMDAPATYGALCYILTTMFQL